MKIAVVLAAVLACAYAAPNKYIIDGDEADIKDFPYLVSVQWGKLNTYYHICGGVILDEFNVLTARHCCQAAVDGSRLYVLTDSNEVKVKHADIPTLGDKFHEVEAMKFKEDKQGYQDPPTKEGDLCILQLKDAIKQPPTVNIVPIPTDLTQVELKLAGWGTKDGGSQMSETELLQSSTTNIIEDDDCKKKLDGLGVDTEFLHPDNFCTMHDKKGESTSQTVCNGDSGGPLVSLVSDENGAIDSYNLYGVVSWGIVPCGAPGIPSIYTNVETYKSQIENNKKKPGGGSDP